MAEEQSPWINYIEQHLPEYQKVIKDHANYVAPTKAKPEDKEASLVMDNIKVDITNTPLSNNEGDGGDIFEARLTEN